MLQKYKRLLIFKEDNFFCQVNMLFLFWHFLWTSVPRCSITHYSCFTKLSRKMKVLCFGLCLFRSDLLFVKQSMFFSISARCALINPWLYISIVSFFNRESFKYCIKDFYCSYFTKSETYKRQKYNPHILWF